MAERQRKVRESTETSVLRIMRKMALGTWIPGVSEWEFCKRHNINPGTVRQYALEASRRISAGVRLDDQLRDSLVMQLQTNASIGQQLLKLAKEKEQYRDAVGALRAKNEALKVIAGMHATSKRRPDSDEDDDLSGKSERELLEIIAKSAKDKE